MLEKRDAMRGVMQDTMGDVIEVIRRGGVGILPTDTVYGIGCLASNEEAVRRIFEIKGRSREKAINVLVATVEQVRQFAEISAEEERLIREYMPGGLTVILRLKPNALAETEHGKPNAGPNRNEGVFHSCGKIAPSVVAGGETIGVRIPDNEGCLEILREVGSMAVTSANLAGEKPALEIGDVVPEVLEKMDFVIDEGKVRGGEPSTIVKVERGEIRVLREGPVRVNGEILM